MKTFVKARAYAGLALVVAVLAVRAVSAMAPLLPSTMRSLPEAVLMWKTEPEPSGS